MSFLISRMGRRSHTSLEFTGNILDILLLLVLVIIATVITVITRGSVFKYKCDRGFRMHGSSLLTCAGCARRWCWWSSSYLFSYRTKISNELFHSSTWEDRLTNISLIGDHGWDLSRLPLCASEIKLTFYQILFFLSHLSPSSSSSSLSPPSSPGPGCDESLVSRLPYGQAKRRAKGAVYVFRSVETLDVIVNMMLMNVIGAFIGWWPQLLRIFLLQMQRWLNNGGEQHCSLRWPQLELLGADLSK